MTKAGMEKLLKHWQPALGLSDWRIVIEWDELPHDDAHATVITAEDYCRARILLSPTWKDWDAEYANYIIVHELLHAKHRDLDAVPDSLQDHMSQPVWELTRIRYSHELEQFIDSLARNLTNLVH